MWPVASDDNTLKGFPPLRLGQRAVSDDNKSLWGQFIDTVRISAPEAAPSNIAVADSITTQTRAAIPSPAIG
jgi:hypothetical protein